MKDVTPQVSEPEKKVSELKDKVDQLERSLQQALYERDVLEFELEKIKNSLSWLTIIKYRELRDWCLPIGTRRRHAYDAVRGNLRALVLHTAPSSDLTRRHIPEQMLSTPEVGSIEQPLANETVRRMPIGVWGWVVLAGPLARVDITVDGEVQGAARLGVYRPELAVLFPGRPDAIVSGFEYLLDLTGLPGERSTVSLGADARGLDGSCYKLSEVTIGIGPRETPYEDFNGRTARLRAEPRRQVSRESGTGEESIRLLAFTHHLGYGGGQLYLYELLRQLRRQDDFTSTVVAPEDGPLRSAIEDLGIPVHVTHGYPYQNLEMFERQVHELMAWARPQGFNAALVNTVGTLPGPEVAIGLDIPFVWAIHESWTPHVIWSVIHPPPGAHPQVRRRVIDALSKAAAVVFEADATRLQYQPYGDPERFIIVPYGIDVGSVDRYRASFDRVSARRRLGIPNTATAILCMSTIEPRKAQVLLVQAFRQVAEAHPDAFLILVGDTGSPYGKAVRSLVAAAGLRKRVIISRVVPEPYEWYAAADFLVCPSDVESLPRCVLEAMAFELPVLATEVFGLPELIKDGENGYLCRPCDLGALATALDRVLSEDKEKRRQVARNGANLVRTRHDSRGYANAYLRLMRGLIQNPEAKPRDLLAG